MFYYLIIASVFIINHVQSYRILREHGASKMKALALTPEYRKTFMS